MFWAYAIQQKHNADTRDFKFPVATLKEKEIGEINLKNIYTFY